MIKIVRISIGTGSTEYCCPTMKVLLWDSEATRRGSGGSIATRLSTRGRIMILSWRSGTRTCKATVTEYNHDNYLADHDNLSITSYPLLDYPISTALEPSGTCSLRPCEVERAAPHDGATLKLRTCFGSMVVGFAILSKSSELSDGSLTTQFKLSTLAYGKQQYASNASATPSSVDSDSLPSAPLACPKTI